MPGGKVCSVVFCRSNSKKVKESGENIKFFAFPKDPVICEEWVRKCYRSDKFSVDNKRICSKHFTPEDFEDKMRASLMGTQPKVLKKTAIPSVDLLPLTNEVVRPTSDSECSKRAEENERKAIVESILFDESTVEKLPLGLNETVSDHGSEVSVDKEQELQQQIIVLKEENKLLKRRIQCYKKRQNNLEKQVAKLEKELNKYNVSFEEKAKEVFKDFLSPNQIVIALYPNKREELLQSCKRKYPEDSWNQGRVTRKLVKK